MACGVLTQVIAMRGHRAIAVSARIASKDAVLECCPGARSAIVDAATEARDSTEGSNVGGNILADGAVVDDDGAIFVGNTATVADPRRPPILCLISVYRTVGDGKAAGVVDTPSSGAGLHTPTRNVVSTDSALDDREGPGIINAAA